MAELTGLVVTVRNNDINRALKELKKMVYRSGIMIEYRKSLSYEKPSEKKKKKHLAHLIKVRKEKLEDELAEN
jgi:ribosomal protein S21